MANSKSSIQSKARESEETPRGIPCRFMMSMRALEPHYKNCGLLGLVSTRWPGTYLCWLQWDLQFYCCELLRKLPKLTLNFFFFFLRKEI